MMNKDELILTIRKIQKQITTLNRKQRNTIYHFRIAGSPFIKDFNIFFEWNKINRSTTSRQVGTLSKKYAEDIYDFKELLEKETGITVNLFLS